MKLVRASALALATLALSIAFANERDLPPGPLSVPADCTWESARPISLEELERNYLDLYGECVRTSGWTDGTSIGVESDLFAQYWFAGPGIFSRTRPLLPGLPLNIEAFGVVGACENVCPAGGTTITNADGTIYETICMPSGVCHWMSRYPYLLAQDYRILPSLAEPPKN